MNKREALIKKIEAKSDSDDIVTLDEFFEGNDDMGSIGCNLFDHPGVPFFYNCLQKIRDRADVQDVFVQIHEIVEDDESWPFSERIYVLTSAPAAEVAEWLIKLEPDEVDEGWYGQKPSSAPELKKGYSVINAWWD